LQEIAENPAIIDRMRPACVKRASQFQPSSAIAPLIQNLK